MNLKKLWAYSLTLCRRKESWKGKKTVPKVLWLTYKN